MCFGMKVTATVTGNLVTRACVELCDILYKILVSWWISQPSAVHPTILKHEIEKVPWYKNLDRKSANSVLSERKIDGDFVVRPSSKKDNVCCLSVFQEDQVFHINVRRRSDGFLALGKSKPNENCFSDIQEIVQCHMHEKLFINSNGKKVNTILKYVNDDNLVKIGTAVCDLKCNGQ